MDQRQGRGRSSFKNDQIFKKVDLRTAWEILPHCWRLMEVNYPMTLFLGFLCFLVSLIKVLPGFFISPLLYPPSMLLAAIVGLWASEYLEKVREEKHSSLTLSNGGCESKESPKGLGGKFLGKIFGFYKNEWFSKCMDYICQSADWENIKKILPLILIGGSLSFFQKIINSNSNHFSVFEILILNFLIFIFELALCLTVAHIIIGKSLDWKKSLFLSLKALFFNALPMSFLLLFYFSTFLLCFIFFMFPVLFVFYPLSITFNYVLYETLFEIHG